MIIVKLQMRLEQLSLMNATIFQQNHFERQLLILMHFYLYGLTATPKRKNNDQKLIFVYIGNILHQVNQQQFLAEKKY